MGRKATDIPIGSKFGKWTVVSYAGVINLRSYHECQCECGNTATISTANLRYGRSSKCKSCANTIRLYGNTNRRKKPGVAGFNKLFDSYKRKAVKREISYQLDPATFTKLVKGTCYYCGIEPSQLSMERRLKTPEAREHCKFIYNGIDRVNNEIGYIPENCVTSCGQCNIAKHTHSHEQFFAWLKRVIKKWPQLKDD